MFALNCASNVMSGRLVVAMFSNVLLIRQYCCTGALLLQAPFFFFYRFRIAMKGILTGKANNLRMC